MNMRVCWNWQTGYLELRVSVRPCGFKSRHPHHLFEIKYARVVELADSLDSGSSAHYGRAGSSPASRTKVLKLKGFSLEFFYIRFLVVVEN